MLFSENAKHMFRHSVHVKKEKKFCIFQNTLKPINTHGLDSI